MRLWAEEALYRVRKREGRVSPIDTWLENHWAGRPQEVCSLCHESEPDLTEYAAQSDEGDEA